MDVDSVLQRLDRLTQDEAHTTTAEIFKVIHGLVQNVNGVMDGNPTCPSHRPLSIERHYLDGKQSVDGIRQALGMFCR